MCESWVPKFREVIPPLLSRVTRIVADMMPRILHHGNAIAASVSSHSVGVSGGVLGLGNILMLCFHCSSLQP
mgnify:FL=1